MWLRKYTTTMGFDQQEFVNAFLIALKNEAVIKQLDDSLGTTLKFEIGKLNDTSNDLSKKLDNFNELNNQLKKEVAELRDIVKAKDSKISALEARIDILESKSDDQEQYSRRNSLRMTGIPEENNEILQPKVLDILNSKLSLDAPIEPAHIDRMHRVGKPKESSPRAILIKFTGYGPRSAVYKNRRNLKFARTATPENGNPAIYINEDLTRFRSNLLYQARRLKTSKKIKGCWSSDGTILIQNNAGKIFPISTVTELNRLSQ